MPPATSRLLAGALAALVLTPTAAEASPYRVGGSSWSSLPAETEGDRGPTAGAPTDSAAIAAATSPTQPLSDDPALEYRLGEQAYALGNYEQAVRHFERSYQLSNFADLLYNLGLAYTQWHGLDGDVGHLRKAKRLFQNYIKRVTEDPAMDQSQRTEAEAQVTRLDEQIREYEARTAAATVVPEPVVERAPQAPVRVDPPTRKPVYKRGWFWAVIGAVVVAGAVTTAVVLTRKPGFEPELGSIGPTSQAVGLRF